MVKYVINETQDENEPDAVEQIVQILTTDLPEDKELIMTFAQQLKQQGLEQGLQQGLEEGEHRKAITKRLITQGKPIQYIQDLTGLPENEVMDLVQ